MADSPKRVSVSREATPPSPHVTTHPDLLALIGGSSDGESEDDAILRPKGRFAARMQQQAHVQDSSDESGSEEAERRTMSSSKRTTETHEENDQEDEDEVTTTTARPRKLVSRRQQRSTTPESRSQERTGSESPGLFVSPTKVQSPAAAENEDHDSGSDDGLPTVASMAKKARLLALEAKKRKAREEKEAEEARKREERLAAQQSFNDDMDVDGDSGDNISDDEGGHRLTQKTGAARRPAPRKASKKALEEMNRETQRMTRSLQLAHEVKVKKKISKSTLFERFNFKVPGMEATASKAAAEAPASSSRPASPVSHHQTDAEDKDTPPSSPPAPSKDAEAGKEAAAAISEVPQDDGLLSEDENGDLPTLEAALASSAAKPALDKGKGKEIAVPQTKRNFRVKLPANITQVNTVDLTMDDDDDDDDLAILPKNKSKLDAIFDRVPVSQAKESRPMQILRRLAHIDDPERKGAAPITKKGCPKQTNQPPPMTVGELEMSLLRKARMQAKLERDRHLEMLRSKGIHVQTAEEREAELQEVEDIVSRARKEAEELMKREREAAKAERKARKDAGEVDALGWDDSDESGDEDYQNPDGGEKEGEEDEEEAELELELSGSEEEEEDEDVDMDEEEEEAAKQADPAGALFDDAAGSAEESADEQAEDGFDDEDSDEEPSTAKQPRRRAGKQRPVFLSDSEDDEEGKEKETPRKPAVEATPRPKANYAKSPSGLITNDSPNVPTSVLRSATKTFIPGLPVAGPAGLGLTQIFAGTMDDSQFDSGSVLGSPSQPMPTFQPSSAFTKMLNSGKSATAAKSQTQKDAFEDVESSDFPDSNFSQTAQEVGEDMILDSQPDDTRKETQDPETQGVQLRFSQSQMAGHGFDTFLEENQSFTQVSELIEPTQDGGFHNFSPLKRRFIEQPPDSTIDTVKLDGQSQEPQSESPLVRRTGKLRRKADLIAARSRSPSRAPDNADEDMEDGSEAEVEAEAEETDEFGFGTTSKGATTAFEVMKEAAIKEKKAKARAEFDKKKSKAREMVDAEAEESEDEYAGLGGVDGEDSDDDGDLEEIIDDQTKTTESDERKLAALHADQERAADEKQVDKLFRDITTGMLRRKRGHGDWDDLSDDDDGGEARRRMKRQQFAKMQRALFADERISKVAENPRNQAFLRTIEDHGSDDDMDFLFAPPPPGPTTAGVDSQDSEESSSQKEGGTVIPDSQPQAGTAIAERRIANPRRTTLAAGKKKPSNIGDIRESLSSLLEDPTRSSSVIPATILDSDEEMDDDDDLEVEAPATTARDSSSSGGSAANSDKENRNPRRGRVAIVDRISLKRKASSNVSASGDRLAFATASSSMSMSGSFKVPTLLRKATANSLMSSGTGTTTNAASSGKDAGNGSGSVFGEDAKIKKTTTTSKRSGINYFARENERRAALAENERRREARKWKGAEGRGKIVGSLFGAGKFE
ncbi:MRC1-like domain containing protein [Naviculisporaceae sp. PSN 640]